MVNFIWPRGPFVLFSCSAYAPAMAGFACAYGCSLAYGVACRRALLRRAAHPYDT